MTIKVAIVAPSPVPFARGGAENLWHAWLSAMNETADVEAELIKLPSPEQDFWSIVDSYRAFANLDLGHFDRVISTKYPAWMVHHDDHHVYLQHKLRGLYDTWPEGMDNSVPGGAPAALRDVLDVLGRARGSRGALPDIFGALEALRAETATLPSSLFNLPGALIRRVVHALDEIGLARTSIRRYAAISATVAGRPDYFPRDVDPAREVDVYHHPTLPRMAASQTPVPEGAIFSASRLDAPKRMDMLIEAYARAGVDTPLCIAGDGPQREALAKLAEKVPGVALVGRLSDAELAASYAAAGFVAFVPDREDYGLITLEALQAGKPVLTCADSGGVTELVRDGENGLITAPTTRALAEGLQRLATDPALRENLAGAARASVAHIDWQELVAAFTRPWPRILVVNTFSMYPPTSGGKLRIFNLYRELARRADVTCVSLVGARDPGGRHAVAPGLVEERIPMSAAHADFAAQLAERLGASSDDLAALFRAELTPAWIEAIRRAGETAALVVLSHPYGWSAVQAAGLDLPAVYEAHNVEVDLKAAIIGDDAPELEELRALEQACAARASLVTCCSSGDAERMAELYSLATRPTVIANGVDSASYADLDAAARWEARARLGLGADDQLALFVGSLHGPNVDAARHVVSLAGECTDTLFYLLGSVCEAPALTDAFADGTLSPNLRLAGRVSAAELRAWLAIADVGLNPVTSGSGTNLKLLEYAAAGLPIISTPFGGRGGLLEAGAHYLESEIDAFPQALEDLRAAPEDARRRADAARTRAREAGDWRHIAAAYGAALDPLLCG